MGYSDLRKLKKVEETNHQTENYDTLVVGRDLFTLEALNFLIEKKGEEGVRLLNNNEPENLKMFKGPSPLRGSENIKVLTEKCPAAEVKPIELTSTFYKDMKFKEFGGRSKSETLLEGEDFFIDNRAEFNLEAILPHVTKENFEEKVNSLTIDYIPSGVERDTENNKWKVFCTNGKVLLCNELVWGLSPWEFLNLYRKKEELKNEFIEFCESTRTPCSLFIKLRLEEALTEREETLFLPLSYTHEWGHFIGEFKNLNDEKYKQEVEFMAFVNKEESSEEEISKKIRLLKRNLEKIFPEFKKISFEEFISLEDSSTSLKVDDNLFFEGAKELENLNFVSVNAPIVESKEEEVNFEYSKESVAYLTRAFLAHRTLELNFNSK